MNGLSQRLTRVSNICYRYEPLVDLLCSLFCADEWGSITVDYRGLLDGGSIWTVTFNDYAITAGKGGVPLLNVSWDGITNGLTTIERVSEAASPVVHRALLTAASAIDSSGSFEMSVAGVVTRPVSVDASANTVQNVRIAGIISVGSRSAVTNHSTVYQ